MHWQTKLQAAKNKMTISKTAAFSYRQVELNAISIALAADKPWNAQQTKNFKKKIYRFHSQLQKNLCCYCRRNQHGEFKMVIDTEHILPTSKFKLLTFAIWNLSVSCKRCNMLIKKENLAFLRDATFGTYQQTDPEAYLFVHPNLDNPKRHYSRCSLEVDGERIVSYAVKDNSPKGQFTVDYFRLKELEIASFDAAQIEGHVEAASDLADAFQTLVDDLSD
jgi:hypothetical protein